MQIDSTLLPVHGKDAVEILKHDHQVIKGLLDELTGAPQAQREPVMQKLVGALTIHNATEENLVYPALNKVAGSKIEADRLYHETAEADVLVFELNSLMHEHDDATFSKKAKKLTEAVHKHIDEEEKKAFPQLQKNADPQDTELLAESVRTFRDSLHFEVPG